MTVRSLTIVLPAFNEEARLGPALDELFGQLRSPSDPGRADPEGAGGLPADTRVLVVDDGSSDGTADLVRRRPEAAAMDLDGRAPLELLTIPHGGKGAAVRAGMLAAETDLVMFADADMATPPDQIRLLLQALDTADVALGSRIQEDGSDVRVSQPRHRRLLGKAFHMVAALWVLGPIRDSQCGFKAFTREAAQDLFGRQAVTSIVFDVEIIYLARELGYRVAVVPVQWADRRGSKMQARLGLAREVAWDLFRIPLIHRHGNPRATSLAYPLGKAELLKDRMPNATNHRDRRR